MVNVTKQEVRMEESLRKRLEFICEYKGYEIMMFIKMPE